MKQELIKELFILQVRENGISSESYEKLSGEEKEMLESNNGRYYLKTENRKQITVVMTGGAFDVLHPGHIHLLNEAKRHGDVLIVSVARDELVLKKKNKLIHPQDLRAYIVEHLKPVDLALVGVDNPQKTLERVQPDVIVYGYDQTPFLKPEGVKIVKLEEAHFPEKYKSSKIAEKLGL